MNLCGSPFTIRVLRAFSALARRSRTSGASSRAYAITTLTAVALAAGAAQAQVNIYTRGFDNSRSGTNLNETILTPANVNSSQFGKLFTVNLDGEVYAQPLYLSALAIGGGVHNVVYVATMNNTVYALDADNGQQLWSQNFGPGINSSELPGLNVAPYQPTGILSTPVIDPVTDIMYLVHGNETQVNGTPSYQYFLEALNIVTGTPLPGTPVNITASFLDADLTAPVAFTPKTHHQRSSLALANGNIYFAFSSWDDVGKWHGWVMSYSEATLMQNAVYNTTPIGSGGGIWMAGSAPAIDASGNLYYSTGNGSFGTTPNNLLQTSQSIIKLSPSLQLLDYFSPKNEATLSAGDMDIASGGVTLIPNPGNPGQNLYVLGGGKQGVIYLLSINNLGGFNASQDQVVQEFQAVFGYGTSHIHGTPVYFNSATYGPTAFVWGENDYLRGFRFNSAGGLINTTPFAMSTMTAPTTHVYGAMPGGFLSVSANGGSNGIVWASTPYTASAVKAVVQGALYAFSADTLQLLWSDKLNDARDEVGLFAKFCPPIVANGKMYVPTFGPLATGTTTAAGQLVVYGLLPTQAKPTLTVQVNAATMDAGANPPAFSSTVTGLVNGDTVGSTIQISYNTTANSSSVPGSYPVTATVSGSSASNYNIVVNAGTLTVVSAPYYPSTFKSTGLTLNGGAAISAGRLRLTDGHTNEGRSAFFTAPVSIRQFTSNFQFQITSDTADGFTFAIQGVAPTALGGNGGSLGYQGIRNSVAIKFDIYSNAGEGTDSTGIYVNGALPQIPATDLTSTGINLKSGDVFSVQVSYSGTIMTVVITDTVTLASATQSYAVNIPGIVGGSMAYVGFTGGSGGHTAVQDILNWTYTPQPVAQVSSTGFSNSNLTLNGGASLTGGSILLTDGGSQEARSAFLSTPLNAQEFTASFDFRITNPSADGMTFTIQGKGPTAVGSPGSGLGYATIPKSVAIKFDLHSNAGEGPNSTGLYTNGALPTTPAISLSTSEIDLHSGDTFNVQLAYDGTTLLVNMTDTVTGTFFSQRYTVNIPAIVGGSTAYFGFTGGTGGASSTQTILDWSYTPGNG